MAGIYIHIPFCKQKCYYCNFYALASAKYRDVFTNALLKEMKWRAGYIQNEEVKTIYFGGGTPSLLPVKEIQQIIETAHQLFKISNNVEITLEANPDDINQEYLKKLKDYTGINRISLGIQSFFDEDLKYLYRVHSGKAARKSIESLLAAGYNNMNIDLIYGIPTLDDNHWEKNLEIFYQYKLPHLSSYALTVEHKTALQVLIDKNKLQNTDEDQIIRQFDLLLKSSAEHGYVHYEISNFALPGYYSKHNSTYWMGGYYLGLGPSAHSFNGVSRQWNVKNMKQYVESQQVEKIILEREILTKEQQYNEYVMTSLRTSWGCDTVHILNGFGEKFVQHFQQNIQPFIDQKKVNQKGTIYFLTNFGKRFADGIAGALFL